MIQNDKTKAFIEDYNKAIDTEFNLFNADAQLHHYQKDGGKDLKVIDGLQKNIATETKQFEEIRHKLADYTLTNGEAKSILQKQDNQFFSGEPMQGPDCYRFMNHSIKNDKEIALEALKNDSEKKCMNYFPPAIKEKVINKPNPERALENSIQYEKLNSNLVSQSQNQTQKQKVGMTR